MLSRFPELPIYNIIYTYTGMCKSNLMQLAKGQGYYDLDWAFL